MGSTRTTNSDKHPLIARWRWIAAMGVVGGVFALGYTSWIPAKYRVRAQVVMLPQADQLLASSMILSGNTATPLTVLQGVFDSDAMVSALSKQFKITEPTMRSIWFVRTEPLTNQLEVMADSTSPELAQQIVEFSIAKAREFELRANESAAGRREQQLEESIKAQARRNQGVERDLIVALTSSSLTSWNSREATSNLESLQVQLNIARSKRAEIKHRMERNLSDADLPKDEHLDGLRQRVRSLDEELAASQTRLGPQAPELGRIRDQLSVANEQYKKELSRASQAVKSGLQTQIADLDASIQSLSYEVSRGQQEAKASPSQEAALATQVRRLQQAYGTTADLRSRYEQARVDAEVERVNWTVVTPAFREERSINKRWVRNPAAGAVLGMVFAAFLAFSVPRRSKRGGLQVEEGGQSSAA